MSARVGERYFVWLDAGTFESDATRRTIVKFAHIQNATVRQRMSVSNCQHTTTRRGADHMRASFCLQGRGQNLRGTRCAFTGQYNEWQV